MDYSKARMLGMKDVDVHVVNIRTVLICPNVVRSIWSDKLEQKKVWNILLDLAGLRQV